MSILEKLRTEIALAIHERGNLACLNLIYIDLDRFIYHNDSFGHASGDAALNKILGALLVLSEEFCAKVTRVGGDEFMLYSLSSSFDSHIELGKKAQTCIHELGIPLVYDGYNDGSIAFPKHITCSVAAASYPIQCIDSDYQGESDLMIKESIVDGLIKLLDTMLWLSKCSKTGNFVKINLCQ